MKAIFSTANAAQSQYERSFASKNEKQKRLLGKTSLNNTEIRRLRTESHNFSFREVHGHLELETNEKDELDKEGTLLLQMSWPIELSGKLPGMISRDEILPPIDETNEDQNNSTAPQEDVMQVPFPLSNMVTDENATHHPSTTEPPKNMSPNMTSSTSTIMSSVQGSFSETSEQTTLGLTATKLMVEELANHLNKRTVPQHVAIHVRSSIAEVTTAIPTSHHLFKTEPLKDASSKDIPLTTPFPSPQVTTSRQETTRSTPQTEFQVEREATIATKVRAADPDELEFVSASSDNLNVNIRVPAALHNQSSLEPLEANTSPVSGDTKISDAMKVIMETGKSSNGPHMNNSDIHSGPHYHPTETSSSRSDALYHPSAQTGYSSSTSFSRATSSTAALFPTTNDIAITIPPGQFFHLSEHLDVSSTVAASDNTEKGESRPAVETTTTKNPIVADADDIVFNFFEAKALWESHNLSSYLFKYKKTCFCNTTTIRPMIVEVRQGDTFNATYFEDGSFVPDKYFPPTIDEMFVIIEGYIEENEFSLEVEYENQYGYPRNTSIKPFSGTGNDSSMYWVSDLTPTDFSSHAIAKASAVSTTEVPRANSDASPKTQSAANEAETHSSNPSVEYEFYSTTVTTDIPRTNSESSLKAQSATNEAEAPSSNLFVESELYSTKIIRTTATTRPRNQLRSPKQAGAIFSDSPVKSSSSLSNTPPSNATSVWPSTRSPTNDWLSPSDKLSNAPMKVMTTNNPDAEFLSSSPNRNDILVPTASMSKSPNKNTFDTSSIISSTSITDRDSIEQVEIVQVGTPPISISVGATVGILTVISIIVLLCTLRYGLHIRIKKGASVASKGRRDESDGEKSRFFEV